MPDEQRGEEQQRRDHEAPSLMERRPSDTQQHREDDDERHSPDRNVQSEELSAKEQVAQDAEHKSRSGENDCDLRLPTHRPLFKQDSAISAPYVRSYTFAICGSATPSVRISVASTSSLIHASWARRSASASGSVTR